MRICLVNAFYDPEINSMAELAKRYYHLNEVASALCRRGHDVCVIQLFREAGELRLGPVRHIFKAPPTVFRWTAETVGGILNLRQPIRFVPAACLFSVIEKESPEALHFFGITLDLNLFLIGRWAWRKGLPLFATYHGGAPSRRWLRRGLQLGNLRRTAKCQRRSKSTPLAGVKMHHLVSAANYRLGRRTRLNASYKHESTDRSFRRRARTEEDRVRLELSTRAWGWGTLRASWEYADRGGDDFTANPLAPFFSQSIAGFVGRIAGEAGTRGLFDLQPHDIASRKRHAAEARLNVILGGDMDGFVSARFEDENYSADFGLTHRDRLLLNAEWNLAIGPEAGLYIYYSLALGGSASANITASGAADTTGEAGGLTFPLANAWSEEVDESSHNLGIGGHKTLGKLRLSADYTFTYSKSEIDYAFASSGAFFGLFTEAEVGNGFPDQTWRSHLLSIDATYQLTARINLRLYYRFESVAVNDFHYLGLDQEQVLDRMLFLGATPQDFTVHIIGSFLKLAF